MPRIGKWYGKCATLIFPDQKSTAINPGHWEKGVTGGPHFRLKGGNNPAQGTALGPNRSQGNQP
jgi:hypothetical protein